MPLSAAWLEDAADNLDEADKASLLVFWTATPSRIVVIPPTAALLVLGLVYPYVDYKAKPDPRVGWRCTEDLLELYRFIRDRSRPTSW